MSEAVRPLCIYHANCADGFTSAWVVNRYFEGKVDFHPGVYGKPPPDCTRRIVYLVDFSYSREVLERIAAVADRVIILDHHDTAEKALLPLLENGTIQGVFDMERSGAGITWDYFFASQPRPKLLNHIEDRDLWRFNLPGTREIQAAVFSHEYDFGIWDALMFDANLDLLAAAGSAIERKHFKDIKELVEVVTRFMKIGGHIVPIANLPYTLTSDAGEYLYKLHDAPFAGCYWDTPDGRVFSLRSPKGGFDVGATAKHYGGGGHVNASGFTVPFDECARFEVIA